MKAISCVSGPSADIAAERIRHYCAVAGWELVGGTVKSSVGNGTLGWILQVADCTGADRLVLTREGLATLDQELPELWRAVRAWLEDRGVAVVAA